MRRLTFSATTAILTLSVHTAMAQEAPAPETPVEEPKEFEITSPLEGEGIEGRRLVVEGEGASEDARLEITVLSPEPHKQRCEVFIKPDGYWTCGPVFLNGRGPQDRQTIKATMYVEGEQTGEATVEKVFRSR